MISSNKVFGVESNKVKSNKVKSNKVERENKKLKVIKLKEKIKLLIYMVDLLLMSMLSLLVLIIQY